MRRFYPTRKSDPAAVFLRHFFGCGGSAKFPYFFLLFLLTNIYSGFSQDRASEVPTYSHIGKEDLPTVTVNLLSFSVNTEDLTIAIATDPMGNVYTLSFGNGVDKRDADGNLLDGNFITGLKNPLDIAIDAQGYIYIADFEASGDTYEDNGQIKIFDSSGNFVKSILTSYYRPLGVAVDEDFVYIAEYNDGEQGPESTPSSRVRKVSKTTGAQVAVNNAISVPYRIAVNSDGQVYVSKAGGGAAVLILSPTLTVQGQLPGVQSPGSIEVDAFDYVHVLEYSGRIDFSRFINFTSLGAGEIQDIAEDIDKGIDAEAFGVKVYDPSLTLQYFFKQMIDFPVDIAFNSCDRMYINNGDMFGSSSWFGYIPEKMEFDLEIYQRTPSADVTSPIAQCFAPFTLTLDSNGSASLTVDDIDNSSSDNCSLKNRVLSRYKFTTEDIGIVPVTMTVTDESGLTDFCIINVTVEAAAGPEPPEATCKDLTVSLDQNGMATITAAEVYGGTDTSLTLKIDISSFGCTDLGENPVMLTVTDPSTGLSDTCTAKVTIVDDTAPIVNCVAPFTLTLGNDGTASLTVDDIDDGSSDNCRIASRTLSKYEFTSADIGMVPVTLTITDTSGLPATCLVNVTVEAATGPDPPEAVCKDFTVPLDQNGVAAITAAEVYGGTKASLNLAIDVSTFDCSNLGVNTVVLTVTDPATGLSDACTTKITVVDDIHPQFTCPSDQTISLEAGKEFIVPDYEESINPLDNCNFTVTQDPPPGTALTESQRIEIHVIDEAENDTWCSFVVLVEPGPVKCKTTDLFLTQSGDNTLDPKELYDGDVNDPLIEDFTVDRDYFTCEDLGPQTVTLTVHFKDGTSEDCSTQIVVKDEINPEVYCTAPGKEFTLMNGSVTIDVNDVVGQINDNCGDPNIWLSQETFSSAGTKTITINAEDASGNTDSCTTTIEVVEASTTPGSCKTATIYLDASGNAILEPEEVFDGDPDDPAIESLEVDRQNFSCEDVGETIQVNLTVNYSDGSSTTCSASVTVKDNIAPEIVCVEKFTLHLNESGVGRITPEIIDRGSTDNCGFLMSLSRETFGVDDIGEQEVTLTVTDAGGNTSTCTTKVTVEAYDQENPGLTCVDAITLPLNESGDFLLQLNYTGDEENEDYTLSKDTFSCEDLGTQFITVTFWGEYTGTCEIEITVVDETPPVINCLDEIDVRLDASGNATVSAEELDLEFSDNCSVADTSLSRTNFTTADIGESEITFTVIDGSGNESVCTTTVNVLPFDAGEPETIECVDLHVIQIGEDGRAVLNPRDLFTGGTGTAQFELSKDTFTCLDLGENTVTLNYTTPTEEGSCEIIVVVEDPSEICDEPVDPSNGDYIILYPNPSLGIVRFQTSPGLEIHRVEVFDMRGRYLFEKEYDQNSIFDRKLDLQEYQSGVYSILIFTNGKEYLKRAIIKN